MTYQHGRAQVELVEELGDKDVHLQHFGDVALLNVMEGIDEPFEGFVRRTYPDKVDLLAVETREAIGGSTKDLL